MQKVGAEAARDMLLTIKTLDGPVTIRMPYAPLDLGGVYQAVAESDMDGAQRAIMRESLEAAVGSLLALSLAVFIRRDGE